LRLDAVLPVHVLGQGACARGLRASRDRHGRLASILGLHHLRSRLPGEASSRAGDVMTAAGLAPASDLYLLQGGLLFFAGTMLGIPHGLAKRNGDAKRTELWRVAHLSTCVAGVS